MSDLAIKCEGIAKQYRIGERERYKALRDIITDAVRSPFRRLRESARHSGNNGEGKPTIWALQNVSFEVKQGEVVGIIGRNGAGKSTLLKILSRITEPTRGYAEIHGRVGSLLEVGTGFHHELTGRENIFLNGAILGMRKAEIAQKFDEIVAFAEVEKFIETPVKHYSSGMYMRLAFAVAAHLETEILLVDEVLAVGDAAFQKKCLGKVGEVAKDGRTVILVSHNMVAIEALCMRSLYLEHGSIAGDGLTEDVVQKYIATTNLEVGSHDLSATKQRKGSGEIRFVRIELISGGICCKSVRAGSAFSVRLEYQSEAPIKNPVFSVAIFSIKGVCLFAVHTSDFELELGSINGAGCVELEITRPNLLPGRYSLHCAVGDQSDVHRYDHLQDATSFDIEAADVYGSGKLRAAEWSLIFLECSWRMTTRDESLCR
jgi:lipopolysaccharide transport system ATP-binding protein